MKHWLLACALALAAPAAWAAPPRPTPPAARPTATVYVCISKNSYAYHRSDGCQGLSRCSHPLKAMPTAEAEKLGKRACHRCW